MVQEQTKMRDTYISITPYGVKKSVLDSSMSVKFHFSRPVTVGMVWPQTQWGILEQGPCRLHNFSSVKSQKTI